MGCDQSKLTRDEVAYYRTVAIDDLERIQGFGAFIPHEDDERKRDYVIGQFYEKETLPGLRRAVTQLERAAARAPRSVAAILRRQAEHIRFAHLYQRSNYNWYEAGRFLAAGRNPKRGRAMRAIVDDEIRVTGAMIR